MGSLSRGQTFGATESITNTKLHNLVDLGSVSNIVNADIAPAAAIAYSKLTLTGSIVNADIDSSAAIAYSKLNLSGGIVNADINASAAIADSKLAQITTASKVSAAAITSCSSLPSGAGVWPTANLGTGTANSTKFLRGDGAWEGAPFVPNGIDVFTASGTWTKPAGVANVYVKVIGGGGGGGGRNTVGGGGGSGGYSEGYTAVTGNVTVTVGTGGAGGTGTNNGSAGNTSSFAGSTTITATGGSGGEATGPAGAGGSGSNGQINLSGESGQVGALLDATIAGRGGNTPQGYGYGGTYTSAGGNNGSGYGSGGSGCRGSGSGGNGADGVVIVYY